MEDELTPAQTERVRRLLAEARHTEPMPADVVARLDRVLAGLADESGTTGATSAPAGAVPGSAPVVRLDERRRRAGRLLMAAAVVVVGGVAVGQVVGGGSGDESAESTAGSTQDDGLTAPDRDGAESEGSAGADAEMPGAVASTRRSISRQPAVLVRPTRFTTDAQRVSPLASRQDAATTRPPRATGGRAALAGCDAGLWGGGRYVRAVFGGQAGWLVYRPPRGDTQVVDLFLCGEDLAERSATLPLD